MARESLTFRYPIFGFASTMQMCDRARGRCSYRWSAMADRAGRGGTGLLRKRVKQALEDADVLPTIEADRPGARDPQHTVEDTAMVDRWSSSLRFFLHTHPR